LLLHDRRFSRESRRKSQRNPNKPEEEKEEENEEDWRSLATYEISKGTPFYL